MKNKITILFVEDDTTILKMMELVLITFGFHVVPESVPEKALQCFRENPFSFDLVITDYMMPQMDGEALSDNIRTTRPDIPIILCSGSDLMRADVLDRAKVDRFVSKPYDINQFKLVIEQVLEKQEGRRPAIA